MWTSFYTEASFGKTWRNAFESFKVMTSRDHGWPLADLLDPLLTSCWPLVASADLSGPSLTSRWPLLTSRTQRWPLAHLSDPSLTSRSSLGPIADLSLTSRTNRWPLTDLSDPSLTSRWPLTWSVICAMNTAALNSISIFTKKKYTIQGVKSVEMLLTHNNTWKNTWQLSTNLYKNVQNVMLYSQTNQSSMPAKRTTIFNTYNSNVI